MALYKAHARPAASMSYLLIHSMAHHVMHGIARFSGLDLGSLSEVIFPADLAFVVHRRGMTEDLGNSRPCGATKAERFSVTLWRAASCAAVPGRSAIIGAARAPPAS